MRTTQSTLSAFGHSIKLPFNIFADDEDRVLARLDDLHKSVPTHLPKKVFFKH